MNISPQAHWFGCQAFGWICTKPQQMAVIQTTRVGYTTAIKKAYIHTYTDTVSNTVCIHSTKVKYINVTTRRGSGTVKTS